MCPVKNRKQLMADIYEDRSLSITRNAGLVLFK